MRLNWMEGSFNLIKAKSVLVSQCDEHNLQRAIMCERGEQEINYEKRKTCREREGRWKEKCVFIYTLIYTVYAMFFLLSQLLH